jgi:hypothetical protein
MSPFAEITQTEASSTKRYKWASAILAFEGARRSWKQRLDRESYQMATEAPVEGNSRALRGRVMRKPMWKLFKQPSFFSFLIP